MIQVSEELHKRLFQEAGRLQEKESKKISIEGLIWRLLKDKNGSN